MTRWTCPACDREFARVRQSHTCVPSSTLDETFAGVPPVQRSLCSAVLDVVGPVHVDPVRVGVFLSADRKFAELRPKSRWLSLNLVLPRVVHDRRVSRHLRMSATRTVHVIRLASMEDLDAVVRGWLAEAVAAAEDR